MISNEIAIQVSEKIAPYNTRCRSWFYFFQRLQRYLRTLQVAALCCNMQHASCNQEWIFFSNIVRQVEIKAAPNLVLRAICVLLEMNRITRNSPEKRQYSLASDWSTLPRPVNGLFTARKWREVFLKEYKKHSNIELHDANVAATLTKNQK